MHPFVLFALLSVYIARRPGAPIDTGVFAALTVATFVLASLLAAAMFVLWERPFLDRGVELAGREGRA